MSDNTKFNDIYKQMLNDIKSNFKFSTLIIDSYKDDVNYYDMFLKNSLLFLDDLSLGKSDELINKHYYITDGIKFKEIWDDANCNKDTKENIWKYIHSLIFLVCNSELENYVSKTFTEHDKLTDFIEVSKRYETILDNIKNFESVDEPNVNLENSSIGNLAKEIIDEMGIDPESNQQPSLADLGTMMSTTFSKIQSKMTSGELDQEKLLREAQQMMGGMDLFGQGMRNNMPKNMPKGYQGMPKNMNVNKRKVVRKQKKKILKEKNDD